MGAVLGGQATVGDNCHIGAGAVLAGVVEPASATPVIVEDDVLIPQGEDHFKTRVLVSVSSQFFGWVTGIGSGMKITGPENVKAEYKAYLQDVLENY